MEVSGETFRRSRAQCVGEGRKCKRLRSSRSSARESQERSCGAGACLAWARRRSRLRPDPGSRTEVDGQDRAFRRVAASPHKRSSAHPRRDRAGAVGVDASPRGVNSAPRLGAPTFEPLLTVLRLMRKLFLIVLFSTFLVTCGGAEAKHLSRKPGVTVVPHVGRRTVPVALARPSFFVRSDDVRSDDVRSDETSHVTATASPTLASDIASAPNNSVIQLASGTYSEIDDYAARTGWVTISGQGDATPPQIDGAMLLGAQYVRFVDVDFTAEVTVSNGPYESSTQLASNVQILNSEVDCGSTTSAGYTQGIMVRGASRFITISGDWIHNCAVGFSSIAQDPLSYRITITDNTFSDFPGDAIYMGSLDDVIVSHNIIEDISDPADVIHNDGILMFGDDHNISITDNVLANSRVQLIFIQDAIASTSTGVQSNTNILIAHNLIYGAGAVAVQDQGGIGVSFVGNTMWDNYYGSLWVIKSPITGAQPQDTVLIDNVVQGFELIDSPLPAVENHNLIMNGPSLYSYGTDGLVYLDPVASTYLYGAGDEVNAQPGFTSEPTGDYQLSPGSPALGAATTVYTGVATGDSQDPDSVNADMYGTPLASSPALGAFQPGDPTIAYGAPQHHSQWALPLYTPQTS